jgi:hypothetical protein
MHVPSAVLSPAIAFAACVVVAAQAPLPVVPQPQPFQLTADACTRVADAKLAGGSIDVSYQLTPRLAKTTTVITLLQGGATVTTIWSGREIALGTPTLHSWNGRNAGSFVPPGSYTVRVQTTPQAGGAPQTVDYPLDLVRLGLTEIQAAGPSKWQMVYYKKGALYRFFATPALHEYYSVAETGDVADLDLNDGSPRPAPAIHTGLASPPLLGANYEDDNYNFPICYVAGSRPKLVVRFGVNCTDGQGAPLPVGYPLAGMPIRCHAATAGVPWIALGQVAVPGGTSTFEGQPLTTQVGRTDLPITWTFDVSPDNGVSWLAIPGHIDTQHRFYTILSAPRWGAGATGLQYAGPWVEVVEDIQTWKTAVSPLAPIDTSTPEHVVEALIKGFSGQIGTLTTAIEGVMYDTGVLGGDGGASHYYQGFPPINSVQLSHLLDAHSNGVYVNCSDCASSTATMLSMLGVANVQLQRLGSMTLRAIRGIGAPAYTLSLWGPSFAHAFSYHHIITRNGGVNVSDACLWVDEDGNPNALPGAPGYNTDRLWNNAQTGYMGLAAIGTVTWFLDPLPTLL